MPYTISQVAEKTNLPPSTLRYYEKEGLLSGIGRTESGVRRFSEEDLEQLTVVCCLKETGMPLKDIKRYFDLCAQGDETVPQRLEIFETHRKLVLKEIAQMKKHLEKIDKKIKGYQDKGVCGTK